MKALKQIGIFSGIALVGAAAIIPFTTSCKKKENPVVTPEIIDQATFDDNVQYQVSRNTTIYTSLTNFTDSHNVFFDLNAFSASKGNAAYFIIDGTINFGILVGFNENVNLYGENGSLIGVNSEDNDVYGILVGSTVHGNNTYTGNMYIDKSVSANIDTSVVAYGVCINSTVASSITINGSFVAWGTGGSSGVRFGSTVAGSTTIDGNFSISSNGSSYGVRFNSTASDSTQNINGNFSISSSTWTYGVYFDDNASGSIIINGNFHNKSGANSNGVWFDSTADGSLMVGGNFSVSSSSTYSSGSSAIGIYFGSTASGSVQNINGNFSVSCAADVASGVYFGSAAAGSTTINGNFLVSSSSGVNVYGVHFGSTTAGSVTINGNFSIFSGGSSSSAYGVRFGSTPWGTRSGTPTFYSNRADSGNWKTYGGTESWNGDQAGTTTDAAFVFTQVSDNATQYIHFSFLAISDATRVDSKTTFDNLLINAFENLSDGYIVWSTLATNIRDLLS